MILGDDIGKHFLRGIKVWNVIPFICAFICISVTVQIVMIFGGG